MDISGKVLTLTGGGIAGATAEARLARGTKRHGQHRLLGADRAYHLLTRFF